MYIFTRQQLSTEPRNPHELEGFLGAGMKDVGSFGYFQATFLQQGFGSSELLL